MVNITIFIEGGILPNDNISARTYDNSEKLRESFYSILSQLIPPSKFHLNIKQGSGNIQTVKFFKSKISKNPNSLLLIDLDEFKTERDNKIEEFDLTNYEGNIFFMVQEMEAWIISQIDKIDQHYKGQFHRKKRNEKLSNDEKIKSKHPENIVKPSNVLKILLGKYYSYNTNKRRNKKYGKMKDGAELLAILNANELKETFSEFNKLILKIEQF